MKVGITGQAGFIGSHLFNFLGQKDEIIRIPFKDKFFSDHKLLNSFVKQCDVIVHLAAMNRHNDPNVIYKTNIKLVKQLIKTLEDTNSKPHVIFSSSTQEERDNLYGKSKKDGRKLLDNWAKSSGGKFTALIIPNVFGPFGNPYYNSVIATFCHQLVNNEKHEIHVDGLLNLIYINELVEVFYNAIKGNIKENPFLVNHTSEKKVTEILKILESYKEQYFENHTFPNLNNSFEIALFNTFRCFFDFKKHYPVLLNQHTDKRGSFVETIKMEIGGQVSFSTTKPGIIRGNHYHTRKIERFIVIKGEALIQLRRIGTKEIIEYKLSGEKPAFVDMPIWYTHNIKNIGNTDLYTIFWINEFFNVNDPDTYYEKV